MSNTSENNKRIAKNTLMLYGRMFLLLAISLYTSRVILRTFGIVDYGINNVVGGVITMFSFLTSAMATSTQRYITFYIGKGDAVELHKVFSLAVWIHALIAILIAILGETIGLWFVLNKLVIPAERMSAALWVYHLSIISSMVSIISVPYNATIIAHEKMNAFAYISILEAVLKLVIVFLLVISPFDKLIVNSVLFLFVSLLIRYIYGHYCSKHFEESSLYIPKDKNLFVKMFTFAGWNLWGNIAAVLAGQGLNMLLNMFFGPAVNAARGVAMQIQGTVNQFSTNFQAAINPQITKTYATKQFEEMHKLIIRSSKFTYFLLFVICFPLCLEMDTILQIWLGVVPDNSSIFARLMLLLIIIDGVARPLMTAAAATGNVKVYQSVVGGIMLAVLPFSYIVLLLGGAAWTVFVVDILVAITAFVARLFFVRPMIHLKVTDFIKGSLLPCLYVTFVAIPIPLVLLFAIPMNLLSALLIIMVSIACAILSCFMFGLTQNEKSFVLSKISDIKKKFII